MVYQPMNLQPTGCIELFVTKTVVVWIDQDEDIILGINDAGVGIDNLFIECDTAIPNVVAKWWSVGQVGS